MNLSDMLDVELYNDSLKMFNQAWEETLVALGDDLGEGVLENLCERQVWKSAFMKHVMTLHQQDIVLKKEPRSYAKLRTVVNHILEHQQQNMLISQKERSRDRAAVHKEQKKKAKIVDLGCQKGRARKADKVLLKLTWQRKSRAKDIDQEGRSNKTTISAEPPNARKTGKSISKRRSSFVFQLQQWKIVVMIENVIIGILGFGFFFFER